MVPNGFTQANRPTRPRLPCAFPSGSFCKRTCAGCRCSGVPLTSICNTSRSFCDLRMFLSLSRLSAVRGSAVFFADAYRARASKAICKSKAAKVFCFDVQIGPTFEARKPR